MFDYYYCSTSQWRISDDIKKKDLEKITCGTAAPAVSMAILLGDSESSSPKESNFSEPCSSYEKSWDNGFDFVVASPGGSTRCFGAGPC